MAKRIKDIKDLTDADLSAMMDADNEQYELDLKIYDLKLKEETQRIVDMKCPVCESITKKNVITTHRNGPVVYGGRNPDTKVSDYYVCNGCGVHYTDINKNVIEKPNKPFFYKNKRHGKK